MAIKKSTVEETAIKKSPKTPSREPQTMEELLASSELSVQGYKRGNTFQGTITDIGSKAVYVDIGGKSEGLISGREFESVREFVKTLKIGDKITVQIAVPENDSGQTILSLRQSAHNQTWDRIEKAKENDDEIHVSGKELTRGGLLVEVDGIPGFLPTSQIGQAYQGKMKDLVGKNITVKIVDLDKETNRLVVSEKAVSEKEKIEKIKQALEKVKVGEVVTGEITAIFPFGLFVKVNLDGSEFEGLVHISEVSWERVEELENIYQIGEKIQVKVIGTDPEAGRLSLSFKQLGEDPWQKSAERYQLESVVVGKVTKLTPYGAVVEIEPGIEGLIHISKIPLEAKIDVGDTVDCYIESIEPEKRRLSLGMVIKEKPMGYK